MEDVQNRKDRRGIPINKVGVSNLRYPIVVLDRAQEKQQTVAKIRMSVNLPHNFKGTHMSRFVEVLNEHHEDMTLWTLPKILHKLRKRLNAHSALSGNVLSLFYRTFRPGQRRKSADRL